MPIYEYECESCGQTIEVLQSLSDPAPEACPNGDGGKLRRILSVHNVGGAASGFEAASCESSPGSFCGDCGRAGTGCS